MLCQAGCQLCELGPRSASLCPDCGRRATASDTCRHQCAQQGSKKACACCTALYAQRKISQHGANAWPICRWCRQGFGMSSTVPRTVLRTTWLPALAVDDCASSMRGTSRRWTQTNLHARHALRSCRQGSRFTSSLMISTDGADFTDCQGCDA